MVLTSLVVTVVFLTHIFRLSTKNYSTTQNNSLRACLIQTTIPCIYTFPFKRKVVEIYKVQRHHFQHYRSTNKICLGGMSMNIAEYTTDMGLAANNHES